MSGKVINVNFFKLCGTLQKLRSQPIKLSILYSEGDTDITPASTESTDDIFLFSDNHLS